MKTISAEQFKKQFGEDVYDSFGTTKKKQSFLQDTVSDVRQIGSEITQSAIKRSEKVDEALTAGYKGEQGALRTTGQIIGQGAGFASDIIGSGIKGAVKAVLPQKAETAVKGGLESVFNFVLRNPGLSKEQQDKAFQTIIDKYNSLDPKTKRDIDAALGFGTLALDVSLIGSGSKLAKQGLKQGAKAVVQGTEATVKSGTELVKGTGKALAKATKTTSPDIMNRVVRLSPNDINKFTNMAGKSPGKYLSDTGNFGNPQDIITREYTKFIQSRNMVDDAFSKLPGQYRVKQINTALEGIIQKGTKVSSPGARADYLSTAKQLLQKSKSQGLSMEEINQVKRIFERELKLGYNKTLNPDLVDKATRIDKAIRNWQFRKAADLGFKNIREMNKQTQISKFLVDKLGNKVVGQQALNNVSLTDWIMLSGGDPAAVGGFLTKKFFSSKSVQAKIAKMLSGKEGQGMITPETFKPSGLLEKPKIIDLPEEGVLRGQSNIKPPNARFTNLGVGGEIGREIEPIMLNETIRQMKNAGVSSDKIQQFLQGIIQGQNVTPKDVQQFINVFGKKVIGN